MIAYAKKITDHIFPYLDNENRLVTIGEGRNITNKDLITFQFEIALTIKNYWRRKKENLELETVIIDFSMSAEKRNTLKGRDLYEYANNIFNYVQKVKAVENKVNLTKKVTKTEYEFYIKELDRHMCHYQFKTKSFSNEEDLFEKSKHMFANIECVKEIVEKAY